jgi:hypothetical protein
MRMPVPTIQGDDTMPLFLSPKRLIRLKTLLPRLTLTRRTPQLVKRSACSRKEAEGWELVNGATDPQWHGYYRTRYGSSFQGRVENLADPKFYIRIVNPPQRLKEHRHWICFRDQKNGGWYWVHLSPVPADIDSGILAIERNLNEALAPVKKTA